MTLDGWVPDLQISSPISAIRSPGRNGRSIFEPRPLPKCAHREVRSYTPEVSQRKEPPPKPDPETAASWLEYRNLRSEKYGKLIRTTHRAGTCGWETWDEPTFELGKATHGGCDHAHNRGTDSSQNLKARSSSRDEPIAKNQENYEIDHKRDAFEQPPHPGSDSADVSVDFDLAS